MKKTKAICMVIILMMVSIFSCGYSNAYSVELDPKSLITMPIMVMGGSGTISISNTVSNYTLYYQAVQMSNEAYSQLKKNKEDGENELKSLKESYTELESEVNNLETVDNEAKVAYETATKNNNANSTELEKLKQAYETAKTNYDNKVKEYEDKIKDYNAKVDEFNNKIKDLTPTYVESNWIKTTDGKFKVDLSNFSGEQAFVIWAKLVTSDGNTYYDESIYTMEGTKSKEVKVTGVNLDRETLSIAKGSEYTLTATVTPSDATDKTLKWASDNEDVATVLNGKITAKSVGSATIIATTNDGGYTATCKVIVSSDDQTIAKTSTLPHTGIYSITFGFFVVVSILGIVFYRRYKYLNIK